MKGSEAVDRFGFARLVAMVTPYRATLLFAVLLMLAESAASLVVPWLGGQLADSLLYGSGSDWSPRSLILALALLLGIQALLRAANGYLLGSTGERMLAGLRSRLYEHLQALPLAWHQSSRRGDVLSLMASDATAISSFVTGTLVGFLPHVVTFLGALACMALIDWRISLLALALMPPFFVLMKLLGRRMRPLSRARIDAWSAAFSIADENLENLPLIKSFTREKLESARYGEGNRRLLETSQRHLRMQSVVAPLVRLAAGLAVLGLLWLAADAVTLGRMSAQDLVSLLLYGMLMTAPLGGLADSWGQVQMARGAAERLLGVFAERPEPADRGTAAPERVRGEISFERLSFGYPGWGMLLDSLDLHIAAGETLALTGANGAGKSTLVHLLVRFMDPDAGRIRIDGIDIASMTLPSLRRAIGLVQQHVLLVNATVRENIAFGLPGAGDDDIREAARAAHALAFIEALPEGFDTPVGDQGVRLSGGQRARLALARALLKDPPILVFDEATAMFDPEGEADFIAGCHDILAPRTVILITHRPASLALADRVVELVGGRIREV